MQFYPSKSQRTEWKRVQKSEHVFGTEQRHWNQVDKSIQNFFVARQLPFEAQMFTDLDSFVDLNEGHSPGGKVQTGHGRLWSRYLSETD